MVKTPITNEQLIKDYRKLADLHTQWSNARKDGNAELQASIKAQANDITASDNIAAFTEMVFGDDLTDEQVIENAEVAAVG